MTLSLIGEIYLQCTGRESNPTGRNRFQCNRAAEGVGWEAHNTLLCLFVGGGCVQMQSVMMIVCSNTSYFMYT